MNRQPSLRLLARTLVALALATTFAAPVLACGEATFNTGKGL